MVVWGATRTPAASRKQKTPDGKRRTSAKGRDNSIRMEERVLRFCGASILKFCNLQNLTAVQVGWESCGEAGGAVSSWLRSSPDGVLHLDALIVAFDSPERPGQENDRIRRRVVSAFSTFGEVLSWKI